MQPANQDSYILEPRPYPGLLTLVIPMYNEAPIVPFLREAAQTFVAGLQCRVEVVLVNDGSVDSTLPGIVKWAREDPNVRIINLSRNFGHQIASTAGLDAAEGDAVVLLDADLQDPFEVIHRMIERYCEGYDVVYGQRENRQGETWFKRLTAWLFYRLMHLFVQKNLPVDVGDFRLLSRPCLNALQQMRETHRFLRGMVAWVGFPQVAVKYERPARIAGSTKYPLSKMLAFAWTAATSFSTLPLKASSWMGFIVCVLGLVGGTFAILSNIFHWFVVPGWSSLTVLISIIGGGILVSIGALGEYVGKVYEQTKNRPLYVTAQVITSGSPGIADAGSRFVAVQKP